MVPLRATKDLVAFIIDNAGYVGTALHAHIGEMRAAERRAREAYERGQADPQWKAAQDTQLVTNDGYLQSAQGFAQAAERSNEVYERWCELVDDAYQERDEFDEVMDRLGESDQG